MKIRKDKQKEFVNAGENLREMQEEIAPFIKKRWVEVKSTTGEWYDSESYLG